MAYSRSGFTSQLNMSQGSLVELLQSGVSIARLVGIIADVEAALQHLHQQGFAHNFVSVDRILLRSDGSAMLVDYRWASPLEQIHPEATALCEINFQAGTASPGVATAASGSRQSICSWCRYLSGPGW